MEEEKVQLEKDDMEVGEGEGEENGDFADLLRVWGVGWCLAPLSWSFVVLC